MHVIVERDALAPALDALAKVVGRTKTIPILNNLLIEADDGKVTITAHALDYWMSVDVPADITTPGEITVLSDTLRSVVKGVAAGAQVQISTRQGRTELRTGRSRYGLPSLPAVDFPALNYDFAGAAATFKLDGEQVKTLFERPQYCIHTGDERMFLQGIFLHVRGDNLWGAATDGKKACATCIPLPDGAQALPAQEHTSAKGVIIPVFALDNIIKALATGGTVTVDANKLVARGRTICFGTKMVDATYPDFWRIIPPRVAAFRMVADRSDFAAALGRIQAVAAGKEPRVRLSWSDGDEEARLTLSSADKGDGEEIIALFEPATGEHAVEYNPHFLAASLSAARGERVEYTHQDGAIAAWIADPADKDTVSIVCRYQPLHAQAGPAVTAEDDAEASDAA